MFCLGMRPSELYSLRWEQIKLTETGFLQVTKGKSKKACRTLPLTPEVKGILEYRHREQGFPTSGWVFPTESKSGHLEQGSAKNQHLKALDASGVTAFAPYCLRHTALTNLAPQCDSFALQTIAGHSSIAITQRYVHPQAKAISEAFQKVRDLHRVVIAGGHSEKASEKNATEPVAATAS